jgi:DNA-binding transcriptional regulator YiaG
MSFPPQLQASEMPNVATVLKSEMARVARKEVRGETVPLKKAVSAYRSEIAALKRRAQSLEQALKRLSKVHMTAPRSEAVDESPGKFRFSAKSLASQRRRLGLSSVQCGLLLGASDQSVHNWEHGKTRPLARHMPAIAALRGMTKKEATARLESL